MKGSENTLVIFCCHNCIPKEAISSDIERELGAVIKMVKIPCSGKIEVLHLLKTFETGASGVFVAGCLEGKCQSLDGNLRAKGKVEYTKRLLDEIGIGNGRLHMCHLDLSKDELFENAKEFLKKIRELGPNPLRPDIRNQKSDIRC